MKLQYFVAKDNHSAFKNVWGKLLRLMPFIWPRRNKLLQFSIFLCLLSLVAGRIVNIYVPIYNKLIVDSLSIEPVAFRWDYVVTFVVLKFLEGGVNGSMGVLTNFRSYLWINIRQHTAKELQTKIFQHLHSLPLKWHLNRKTGEVVSVMDRGTDSIGDLLSYILFCIIPSLVDIVVAIVYFATAFNIWFGLIVFTTMSLYILATIGITEWRTKFHREKNKAENMQKAQAVDSLLNYETVKYYSAENFECETYRERIKHVQGLEWKATMSLNFLNIVQNVIVCAGLLAGSLLCVSMVAHGDSLIVGDYVLFASYILQLYGPLYMFGDYYKSIQKYFIDLENMFDLLNEKSDLNDAPNALALDVQKGSLEFRNVSFGYVPEQMILKDVSFSVNPGKTVALVGPSGAGKSTIVRLLFRFYDINSGSILIDNQDIRDVTSSSLRKAIGVVPQDTVLFNDTVKYNIQYGKRDASMADLIAAAKNADIHNNILLFPHAYDTQAGERGLRLSGGEKQRMAIARTLLKDPVIILLDEATSSLDTHTERNIQAALMRVCADRTTLIIAHRLSTIVHADEILFIKNGSIIERGRHDELIALQGVYADMWQQQLKNINFPKKHEKEKVNTEGIVEDLELCHLSRTWTWPRLHPFVPELLRKFE